MFLTDIENLAESDAFMLEVKEQIPLSRAERMEIEHLENELVLAPNYTFDPDSRVPQPLWLGVREGPDGPLVGALHAAPPIEQATTVLAADNPENLPWLSQYLAHNLLINDVAVSSSSRRNGYARALLRSAHSRAHEGMAYPNEFFVTALATTSASVGLFQTEGYNIGAKGQSVPPEYAHGLETRFDEKLLVAWPNCRWVWARLMDLQTG